MTQNEFQLRYKYNPNTDCLGEGGFGKVYKAHDIHLDKYVAIKMAEVKQGLEQIRLRHEVELVNSLPNHTNIAQYDTCHTFSTFTGEYDIGILKYYEYGNLQQLIMNRQLTYYQKDSMLKQILDGIDFLHNQGIIHRDLKPQNILIDTNSNGIFIPKIADFGISKKLDVNKSSVFTNSLAGAGTLSFASPEQLMGKTIRKNTDLWSFGVIVCWMFTGKLPFNSGSLAATSEAGRIELYRQITNGEVSDIIPLLPVNWQNVVKQCLVVDADKRIDSAISCLEILSNNYNETKTPQKTINNLQSTRYKLDATRTNNNQETIQDTTYESFENKGFNGDRHYYNNTSDKQVIKKGHSGFLIGFGVLLFIIILVVFLNKQENAIDINVSRQELVPKSDTTVVQLNNSSNIQLQNAHYLTYENLRYNFKIAYPENILFEQRESNNSDGTFFKTKDGVEKLRVYGISNIDNETANEVLIDQKYDEELYNYSKNNSVITYKKLGNSFFVISGYNSETVFYLKVIKCKDYGGYDAFAYAILTYSKNEKEIYDMISLHVFKSFVSIK